MFQIKYSENQIFKWSVRSKKALFGIYSSDFFNLINITYVINYRYEVIYSRQYNLIIN